MTRNSAWFFIFLLQSIFFFASPCFSAEEQSLSEPTAARHIYIIIDQPSPEARFPIAVPDLVYMKEGEDKEGFSTKIADVLRNDLKIAGFFDVIDKSRFPENPGPGLTSQEVDFKKWTAMGAQAMVKGGLYYQGKHVVMQLRLFDPHTTEMLVGKEYKAEKKNFRQAVHRFMDEIMLALTGERGIFSTRITAACGKVGNREIYIMDVDGENRIQLTKNGTINVSPDWSKDGTQIAFTSYAKYFPEIFVVNTNGKGKPKRVSYNNAMNLTPAWSPDNAALAISSSMSGDPEIYLIDPQGNKLAQLTYGHGIDIGPTWSSDGQNLIFASERAGGLHLFLLDRNGGNLKRLTFAGYQNDQPDWSPRGDKVVFTGRDAGGFDIFTMNADGTLIQRLTDGVGNNESPSYSPDGRYIVYAGNRNYKSDLYIMLWQGSNSTPITDSGDCVNPDWSPWL